MSLYPQHASLPLEQLPTPELEQPSPILYGGPDDERYTATSPEEYLIDLYDGRVEERELGDEEVYAYRRKEVDAQWLEGTAETLWEYFVEFFEEEFGGDDTSCRPLRGGEKAVDNAAREELAPVLKRLTSRFLVVWQCEEVVELRRTYTAAEVRRIVCPVEPAPPYRVEVVTFPPRGGQ